MKPALLAVIVLAASWPACVTYEYEHEFWLRVDGSGTVNVTGRPGLWSAFKGLGTEQDQEAQQAAARALFERSGLKVRSVTLTQRDGRRYLFVSAAFHDLNRLAGTPAFADLRLSLARPSGRLVLEGTWRKPPATPLPGPDDLEGLMAVRFHLPSKVYAHKNAFAGVERGNIVSWRQDVAGAGAGSALELGATLDERSILGSTALLFGVTIVLALGILGLLLWLTLRRGRRAS